MSGMIVVIDGKHYRLKYRDPGTLRPEDKGLWRADRVEWDRAAGRWRHVDDDDFLISDDRTKVVARETGWELRRVRSDGNSEFRNQNNGAGCNVQECAKDARWIPVDDRMPTKRGTYLTFCRFRDGQTEIKVKLWTPTIGFTSQAKAVTHWMPLPPAPEEERNGK